MTMTLVSRRQVLQAGAIGGLNLAIPGMVAARVNAASYFWLLNPGRASVFISAYIGTGGFLGARHAPVFIGTPSNHPAMPDFRGADALFAPADPARLEDRRQLLARLNAASRAG